MKNKMPLGFGVALAQPDQVVIVEGHLVQEFIGYSSGRAGGLK
jgi:hypothetical protein